jgi:hypothetical protein
MVGAVLLSSLLLSATPAQDLADARAAEADLDYQRARILLAGLLDRTDTSARERLEAHYLAGQIERILGNDTEARLHFLMVLSTQPDWTLAPDTPPKVRTFFELVRAEVKERRRAEVKERRRAEEEERRRQAAEAPAAPPSAPAPPGPPLVATIVAGGGAALLAVGVASGVAGEMMFAQTDAPFEDRAVGRTLAVAGWAGAALGALVGVGGAVLLVTAE